jgi:uncharacterized protein (TIGR03083 family)
MTDHDTTQALLGPYALDAVDVDEALEIEAHLDACADCRFALAELRQSVDLLGAATVSVPPPDLRARVLDAAVRRRPARPTSLAPTQLHLVEASRLVSLLAELSGPQWQVPIGPALPGWNVQDLAAHLAASEAVLAAELDAEPFTPEVEDQPTARAAPAIERHRTLSPLDTLAELETAYARVGQAVADLGPDAERTTVSWFGLDFTLGQALTQRAFEIWTHADDIRSALGMDLLAPPGPSLRAMSATAVEALPIMLASAGTDAEGRRARITLEGPGGDVYLIELGLAPDVSRSQGGAEREPDVALELDVVTFCRALADRLAPERVPYRATGDAALARAIVDSLPALAVL